MKRKLEATVQQSKPVEPSSEPREQPIDLGMKVVNEINMLGSRKKLKKQHSNFDDLWRNQMYFINN